MISEYISISMFVINFECLVTPDKAFTVSFSVLEVTVTLFYHIPILNKVPSMMI